MAENGDGEHSDETGPKALRDALDKANKALDELREQNEKLTVAQRSRTIADLLSDKGLSPKVAKLVPSDVQADAESLDAWLKDNEDVFATTANGEGGTPSPDSETQEETDPAAREARERLASATDGAVPTGKEADLLSRMNAANTPEELNEIIRTAQL